MSNNHECLEYTVLMAKLFWLGCVHPTVRGSLLAVVPSDFMGIMVQQQTPWWQPDGPHYKSWRSVRCHWWPTFDGSGTDLIVPVITAFTVLICDLESSIGWPIKVQSSFKLNIWPHQVWSACKEMRRWNQVEAFLLSVFSSWNHPDSLQHDWRATNAKKKIYDCESDFTSCLVSEI